MVCRKPYLEKDFLSGPGCCTLSVLCKRHLKLLSLWLSDVVIRSKDILVWVCLDEKVVLFGAA